MIFKYAHFSFQDPQLMLQYNNIYLPFLKYYHVCQSYPFKTITIAGDWINFTHFIDEAKNNEIISNASDIRIILSTADKLDRNGCISSEKYNNIMVNSFLQEFHPLFQNA